MIQNKNKLSKINKELQKNSTSFIKQIKLKSVNLPLLFIYIIR